MAWDKFVVFDLFSGTQSVNKAMSETSHETYYSGFDIYSPEGVENNILDLTQDNIIEKLKEFVGDVKPDFIWASPVCVAWSIAAISHHWKVEYDGKKIVKRIPISDMAKKSLKMVENVKKIIDYYGVPFAIENPRGTLRKHPVFQDYCLNTAMYCQYGDTRMKPTDIWTNKPVVLKQCKNGSPCHIAAPRGSATGTQGLSKIDRSKVPSELIKSIVHQLCFGGE